MLRTQTIQARHHGKIHTIPLQGAIKEEEPLRSRLEVAQVEAVTATEPTESVAQGPTLGTEAS